MKSKQVRKGKKKNICTYFTKLLVITQIQTHPPVEPKTKTKARNLKNSNKNQSQRALYLKKKPLHLKSQTQTLYKTQISPPSDSWIYGSETKTMSTALVSHPTHIFNS